MLAHNGKIAVSDKDTKAWRSRVRKKRKQSAIAPRRDRHAPAAEEAAEGSTNPPRRDHTADAALDDHHGSQAEAAFGRVQRGSA
jgi:hypothetical protein